MIKDFKKMIFVACVTFGFFCNASIVVDINKGVMKPVSIALNLFDQSNENLEYQFLTVISNDLKGTFLFKPIPRSAFMQHLRGMEKKPTYSLWKLINAQYLMNAELKIVGDRLMVTMVLYDVLSEAPVGTLKASGSLKEWRKLAHTVANNIYARITGEVGYFDTRILYVAISKQSNSRKTYRLAMMDQDGYDHKFLTDGSTIVLTPRFSPTGK